MCTTLNLKSMKMSLEAGRQTPASDEIDTRVGSQRATKSVVPPYAYTSDIYSERRVDWRQKRWDEHTRTHTHTPHEVPGDFQDRVLVRAPYVVDASLHPRVKDLLEGRRDVGNVEKVPLVAPWYSSMHTE